MFKELTAGFNLVDWIFVSWMGFSILLGFMRGFIAEMLSLIGWIVAFTLASQYGAEVGKMIPIPIKDSGPTYIAGFLAVFIGTLLAWAMFRTLLRFAVGKGLFDYLLGMSFGVLRGLVVSMLAVTVLSVIVPLPTQPWWQSAYFHGFLESGALQLKSLLPADWSSRFQLSGNSIKNKLSATLTTPEGDSVPSSLSLPPINLHGLASPSAIKPATTPSAPSTKVSLPSLLSNQGLLPPTPETPPVTPYSSVRKLPVSGSAPKSLNLSTPSTKPIKPIPQSSISGNGPKPIR